MAGDPHAWRSRTNDDSQRRVASHAERTRAAADDEGKLPLPHATRHDADHGGLPHHRPEPLPDEEGYDAPQDGQRLDDIPPQCDDYEEDTSTVSDRRRDETIDDEPIDEEPIDDELTDDELADDEPIDVQARPVGRPQIRSMVESRPHSGHQLEEKHPGHRVEEKHLSHQNHQTEENPLALRPDPAGKASSRPSPLVLAIGGVLAIGLVATIVWAMSLASQRDTVARDMRQLEDKARAAVKTADDGLKLANRQIQETKASLKATTELAAIDQRRAAERDAQKQRGLYIANIQLAKSAWDRGDVAEVQQLLEPYRSDIQRQKLRDYAWYYLWRASHSAGVVTLREHTRTVRHAAFLPDNSRVATLGDDGLLMVWDAVNGRKQQEITIQRAPLAPDATLSAEEQAMRQAGGLAVGPDGQWAAAFGKSVWCGKFQQADQPRLLGDNTAGILSLAMSRDGKLVAAGDSQGQVIVRNITTGQIVWQWKNGRPRALAFTPDGKFLLVGAYHGGLNVWDLTTGGLHTSGAFGTGITSLAVSRDGQTVAVALTDRDGIVRLWEPATGRVRGELRGHSDEVTRVVFSADGKAILTASRDRTARLWSASGSLLRTFRGHLGDVETAAFSTDGPMIVTAGADKTAIVWNIDSNQQFEPLADMPVFGGVNGLAFTPAGDQLIGAGSCEGAEAFLGSWSLTDANRPSPLQTSVKAGMAFGFSPEGRQMAVGEGIIGEPASSRVRVWSMETGRVVSVFANLTGTITSTLYSPDGKLMVVAISDPDEKTPAVVKIWDMPTGILRQTLGDLSGKVEAAFTADSRTLVTITSGKRRTGEIRLWNPLSGEVLARIENVQLADLTTMAVSPDGKFLVTGHGDPADPTATGKARLRIWDLAKRTVVAELPAAHAAAITRITFTRRGVLMASGDRLGNVRLWDFTTRKLLPKQIPQQGQPIQSLAFDFYGARLATAADERCIRVWHVDSAQPLAQLNLALGTPAAIRFTPDGNSLAATTTAGGLILWDAESYRPRAMLRAESVPVGKDGHTGEITCAASLPLGRQMLTGSADKSVKLWDLRSGKLQSTVLTASQAISCLAVSSDGRQIAVGTGKFKKTTEPGELILCELGTRDGRVNSQVLAKGIAVTDLAFTPDGNTLAVCAAIAESATGQNQSVTLLGLTTGKSLTVATAGPRSVAISPDGKMLAVGRIHGEIELWTLESAAAPAALLPPLAGLPAPPAGLPAPSAGLPAPPSGLTNPTALAPPALPPLPRAEPTRRGAAAFAPPPLLSATGLPVLGKTPIVLCGHTAAVASLCFSPDGKTLASGGANKNARIWDTATGEELLVLKHNGAIAAVRFSADGKIVATSDREPLNGSVRLWRAANDDRTTPLPQPTPWAPLVPLAGIP